MKDLENSLRLAVEWLTGPATVKDNQPVGELGRSFGYEQWNGAIRGEYQSWTGNWDSFCPIWHTGQAIKALVMASQALKAPGLLDAAALSASFLLNQQRTSNPDNGLILAFEAGPDWINTSAILEAVDGLFLLSDASGDPQYKDAALRALDWVAGHAWQPSLKKFYDLYDPIRRTFVFDVPGSQNRPLLDDAVFLKAWRLTGSKSFRKIAYDTADTLLADEKPAGNWYCYIPCNSQAGNIHPRHAYWWGLPMLELYRESGDRRYWEVFRRSVQWYQQGLRRDGGLFRDTYEDFTTPSFGHAVSGSACAAICFMKYMEQTGDLSIRPDLEHALDFCMTMQFTRIEDPNLRGAVLEKVCTPNGSDRIPYLVRDLGTIFFIQAASLYIAMIRMA